MNAGEPTPTTSVHVSGFKSLLDLRLILQPHTVITGRSGAGKTHLLEAVALVERTLAWGIDEALAHSTRYTPHTLLHRASGGYRIETAGIRIEGTAPRPSDAFPGGPDGGPNLTIQLVLRRTGHTIGLDRQYSTITAQQRDAGGQPVPTTIPLENTDTPLARLALDLVSGFDLDVADPDMPGNSLGLANRLHSMSGHDHAVLRAHLAALVADAADIRASEGPVRHPEILIRSVGWLPLASLSRFERTATAALIVAAADGSVCVDDLSASGSPERALALHHRLSHLCAGGRYLATTSSPHVASELVSAQTPLIHLDTATRVGGGLEAVRTVHARPVRERKSTEDCGDVASPRAVVRTLSR
nr:hypothetical protein KPHV_85890 [Kitasatospora purpeofusca]